MPTSNPSSLRPDELQWEKRVYARFTKLTRVDLPARMERLAPRLAAGLRALPEVTDGASLDRWFEGYGQLRLDPETRTERGTLPGARGDAQTVWIDLDVLNAQLVGGLAGRCPGVIHPLFEIFRETEVGYLLEALEMLDRGPNHTDFLNEYRAWIAARHEAR